MAAPRRFRERQRAARQRAFLDTARRIVATEGHAALTMQRVTDELGSSVGGIYLYFPTKDALLTELQNDALRVLHTSYGLGQARLAAALEAGRVDPPTAALVRVVASARFWIDAESTLPIEVALSRRAFGDPRAGSDRDLAAPVLPAAVRMLADVRGRLADAVEFGALDPDDDLERAVVMAASVNGVLLAAQVAGWDDTRLDGRHLVLRLADTLCAGWGATRARLAAVDEHLDAFTARNEIAPVPPPDSAADRQEQGDLD